MKLKTLVKVEIDLRPGAEGLKITKSEIVREGVRTIKVRAMRARRHGSTQEMRDYSFARCRLDSVVAPNPQQGHTYFASSAPGEMLDENDVAVRAAISAVAGTLAAMMDETRDRLEEVVGEKIFDEEENV